MYKILVLVMVSTLLFTGCGNRNKTEELPVESPVPGQTENPSEDIQPDSPAKEPTTVSDLEKLVDKLNNTSDEEERTKVLAEIQSILEQAEQNSSKN